MTEGIKYSFRIDDLDKKIYEEPEAEIKYPVKTKKVFPDGFHWDRPNLAERVLMRYQKWFK